jgi:hypothetical protein
MVEQEAGAAKSARRAAASPAHNLCDVFRAARFVGARRVDSHDLLS